MSIPKLGGKALLSTLAVAAVLAPVRLTPSDAIAASVAECTTCCSQAGSLCVVCSASCYAKENAYDNGGGPCVKQS